MIAGDIPAWLSEVLSVVGAAVGVYAAIRADLAAQKVRIAHLERAVFGAPLDNDQANPPRRRFSDRND